MPASPSVVAAYIADRATNQWDDYKGVKREPLKVASIERRLTTISQAHKTANAPFERHHPAIQETWKGIRNTYGVAQVRKEPILIEDLRKMIDEIPIEKNGEPYLKGIRDRAILLIGFSGAFRRSELARILMDDIKFSREGIVVTLRKSKTDQIGEGRDIAIPYGSNHLTCPVRALQDWLEIAEISDGPLFRSVNRHGQVSEKVMADHSVAFIIKSNPVLRDRADLFSGHSLRSGFVTTAAMAGVPEHAIMRQTGHKKSDTLRKYIRPVNIWKENPASKVGL